MITKTHPRKAKAERHIRKQYLLDHLSKKLGCMPDEVGFIFQSKDIPQTKKELIIPDWRVFTDGL